MKNNIYLTDEEMNYIKQLVDIYDPWSKVTSAPSMESDIAHGLDNLLEKLNKTKEEL